MNAVIFDMDGTLFDTERVYQGIWRQLGREFDLPVSDAFLRDLAGCDWASARPVFALPACTSCPDGHRHFFHAGHREDKP